MDENVIVRPAIGRSGLTTQAYEALKEQILDQTIAPGARINIKFDDHGEKKFVTTLVMGSLKKSDRQPPAEKKGARRKKAAPAAV